MTEWQRSCITALASSPLAFDIFKAKQRNKKVLWQYIHRIWPHYKDKDGKIRWLNVGVEIEHDAQKATSEAIKNKILRLGCISYDSGFDGNNQNRLRENRIRLDGIKGLRGLHVLLEDMMTNCYLAKNSSIHMHIDCMFDGSFTGVLKMYGETSMAIWRTMSGNDDDRTITLVNNAITELFGTISELFEDHYSVLGKLGEGVNHSMEFQTLEWRSCKPTFKYYSVVLQMLFCIHITECHKHHAKPNVGYITMLKDIHQAMVCKESYRRSATMPVVIPNGKNDEPASLLDSLLKSIGITMECIDPDLYWNGMAVAAAPIPHKDLSDKDMEMFMITIRKYGKDRLDYRRTGEASATIRSQNFIDCRKAYIERVDKMLSSLYYKQNRIDAPQQDCATNIGIYQKKQMFNSLMKSLEQINGRPIA